MTLEQYAAELEANQAARDSVEVYMDPTWSTPDVFRIIGYRHAADRLADSI